MTGFVTAVGENSGTIEAFRSSVTLTADNTKLDKSPCSLKFGLVCSYNVGTIKNAAVTGVFTFNLVYEGFVLGTSSEAAIASVVGENYGIIEKSLSSVDIGGTIYDKYDRINVGGFVGKTNVVNDTVSSVSDCSYNGTLSLIVDNQSGIMIAGGFVGNAFKGDISHSGVERQVTVNGRTFDPSFIGWSYNLTTVVLGDGVTTIGEGAFTSARVVRFGKNIKTIDANAFRAAYSSVVKEIHIVDLASWCSVNMTGAIAFHINTTLYVDDEPITSLVIPDEVTRISDFVFAGLNITEVNIHRGVTFIGKMAFMRCTDLTSVNFDGTVEEWNNIEKTDDWDDYAGEYIVHCKDGDIAPAESA